MMVSFKTFFFKKQKKDEEPTAPAEKEIHHENIHEELEYENPYVLARRTWNDNLGSVVTAKQSWQIIALLCLFITIISVSGMIMVSNRSQYIPYIVNVDKIGQIHAIGPLNQPPEISEQTLKFVLVKFIENARLITVDRFLQRQAIIDIYAHILPMSPARNKISQWYNGNKENNPMRRAEKELVNTHINDILHLTENTWQISWTESVTDHNGILIAPPTPMKAIITLEIVPPSHNTSEEQMRLNPLGIFIKDFSWSRIT